MILKIVLIGFVVILVTLALVNARKFAVFYQKLKVFYEEVAFEMGKVVWPGREEVVNSTFLVGITTIILTVVIMVVDKVIWKMVSLLF
jgi:preprotein translocase SecE subunit